MSKKDDAAGAGLLIAGIAVLAGATIAGWYIFYCIKYLWELLCP